MSHQTTNRNDGGDLSPEPYAMRGFANTVMGVTLIVIALIVSIGLYDYWHPSTNPKAGPPLSIREILIQGVFGGAVFGVIAGMLCGLGVAVVRLAKR